MKNFEYAQPRTEAEVLQMLSPTHGKTEILAGGTDLVGLMKKMIVTPDRVVNIADVDSLRHIEPDASGGIRIGTSVTLDEFLNNPLTDRYPAVNQAIQGIASIQLQSQGTVGGELLRRPMCWYYRQGHGLLGNNGNAVAQGDNRYHAILGNRGPAKFVNASRLAPALISLGAVARIIGPREEDERFVAVEDLFRTPAHDGQRENVLEPGQVLTHIVIPPDQGRLSATYEVRQSEGPDMPLAAAAVTMSVVGGVVDEARVVMGQVAPTPWLSIEAARCLFGRPINETTAREAGIAAVSGATPLKDNQYKVQLAQVAVNRAILLAGGLDTGGF